MNEKEKKYKKTPTHPQRERETDRERGRERGRNIDRNIVSS